MEQIKRVLAAIQRGAAIHPTELAQAQAEVAKIEKSLHPDDHNGSRQKSSVEREGFLWFLSHR